MCVRIQVTLTPMALRHLIPLSHEDWVALLEDLKKGPSPEQARAVEDAREDKAPEILRRVLIPDRGRYQVLAGGGSQLAANNGFSMDQIRYRRMRFDDTTAGFSCPKADFK